MKDREREVAKYQALLETKEKIVNELQRKLDEQGKHIKSIVCIFHMEQQDLDLYL